MLKAAGILVGLSCATLTFPALSDQPNPFFVPAREVAVRVMSDVPAVDLAPGVHVRTVVGTTGSFSLGEFDPGSAAPLHHHTREQADIAVSGVFDVTLGDRVEKLRPGRGLIIPADVPHSIANNGRDRAIVIEFHTVRRPDLVPPRPVMTFPASEKPAQPPAGRPLIVPMKPADTLHGNTCVLSLRLASRPKTPIEIAAGSVERFAYLIRGEGQMASAGRDTYVGAGYLIVVPARGTITIQGAPEATIAEFVPSASSD